jgi:thioredoxin-related protein
MNYLLFTTNTCPKCPAFKDYVKNNFEGDGKILDNTDSNFLELIKKYQVSSAPFFIAFKDDQEIFKTGDLAELMEFKNSL